MYIYLILLAMQLFHVPMQCVHRPILMAVAVGRVFLTRQRPQQTLSVYPLSRVAYHECQILK